MNWIALGAIAEAIGVITILVSLLYVAVQIRQNTQQISQSVEAARLAALEHNIESGNRIRELLIQHPEITQIFLKGLAGYSGLEPLDKFRFEMLMRNIFSSIQGAYMRQFSVKHDPQGFEGIARVVDDILSNPGVREFLQKNTLDWRPEFQDFVDSRLLRTHSSNMP